MTDIEAVKKQIMMMLSGEGFQIKEIKDSNTHFNLMTMVGGLSYYIFQNVNKRDSIFIAGNFKLAPHQVSLFSRMEQIRRKEFFWNLRISLLTRQGLGDFKIKPKPPEKIEEIFLSSKPVFYDGLTKEKLFSTLFEIHKCSMMVKWMFDEALGAESETSSLQLFFE
ncbi:MAG: DUF2299 family protein [Candidatus Bathyarchaeota archaeon]|nr:DUF2299 family protein [Candidatus Bathyarchaeota archaeon]